MAFVSRPQDAKSMIVIEQLEDGEVVAGRMVAYSSHRWEIFRELRSAARFAPETQSLATQGQEQRDFGWGGRGVYLSGPDKLNGWQVAKRRLGAEGFILPELIEYPLPF